VNETPAEDDSRASSCFNATLAKALASGDEPMSATAKYKDPSSFYPQCLLMFCTNSHPIFPAKDGGLKSRISYVAMPFEWVQEVTQAGQRQIDASIKETVVKMLQPEFLFWARLLAQGLKPKGRLISPRPESVRSDTENQFFCRRHSCCSRGSPLRIRGRGLVCASVPGQLPGKLVQGRIHHCHTRTNQQVVHRVCRRKEVPYTAPRSLSGYLGGCTWQRFSQKRGWEKGPRLLETRILQRVGRPEALRYPEEHGSSRCVLRTQDARQIKARHRRKR
jgi:hypothetical protein